MRPGLLVRLPAASHLKLCSHLQCNWQYYQKWEQPVATSSFIMQFTAEFDQGIDSGIQIPFQHHRVSNTPTSPKHTAVKVWYHFQMIKEEKEWFKRMKVWYPTGWHFLLSHSAFPPATGCKLQRTMPHWWDKCTCTLFNWQQTRHWYVAGLKRLFQAVRQM